MARNKFISSSTLVKKKVKRKGIHAKSKTSKNKGATNYVKPYNKQGKWVKTKEKILIHPTLVLKDLLGGVYVIMGSIILIVVMVQYGDKV